MKVSSLQYLTRSWFLLALGGGCALAALWPRALDWTRPFSPAWIMPVTLFISAVTMENRRLRSALAKPWPALWAVLVGYTLPPLLSWGFGELLPPDYRVGLLICSAAPCT